MAQKRASGWVLRPSPTQLVELFSFTENFRKDGPELIAEVDIMSQPASNVDSISQLSVEGQAQEYPCSVWQRDSFSSVFTESAAESMALAQPIGCLVAAKCTSKRQITDSDFATQFKAFVRKKLVELRVDFQASKQDLKSYSQLVFAQQQMRDKNLFLMSGCCGQQ